MNHFFWCPFQNIFAMVKLLLSFFLYILYHSASIWRSQQKLFSYSRETKKKHNNYVSNGMSHLSPWALRSRCISQKPLPLRHISMSVLLFSSTWSTEQNIYKIYIFPSAVLKRICAEATTTTKIDSKQVLNLVAIHEHQNNERKIEERNRCFLLCMPLSAYCFWFNFGV